MIFKKIAKFALVCIPFLVFFALMYPRDKPEEKTTKSGDTRVAAIQPSWLLLFARTSSGGVAGGIPLSGVYHALTEDPYAIEPLPHQDPFVFVEQCLERYDREVTGYKAILVKREKVRDRLRKEETVRVTFKEDPHSIHMKWLKGSSLASAVLFVKGKNNDQLLARILFTTWPKSLDDATVRSSSRININQFGMHKGMQRMYDSWKKARDKNELKVKYEGVYRVKEAGDRLCYKLHRTGYRVLDKASKSVYETESIFYIDKETWLQVGSILNDADGNLIARYFFKDIELNPDYPKDYFNRSVLSK